MERLTRLRESHVKRKQKLSGYDQNEVAHRLGTAAVRKVCGLMGWKTLGPVTPPVKRALATVNSNKPKGREAFTNFFNDADDFNSGDSGLDSQIDSSNLLDESPRPARLSLDDRASPDSVLPLPMQHRAKKANRCEKQRLLYAGFDSQYGSGSGRNL
ncbi:hypothetical protein M3Y99_01402700 [Aphelenchoides fujianensis]|nr:hypothetical protein M3Y99_01402700 [Aphelenchoides fujianensis]